MINFHASGKKEIILGEELGKIYTYFLKVSTYSKVLGTSHF